MLTYSNLPLGPVTHLKYGLVIKSYGTICTINVQSRQRESRETNYCSTIFPIILRTFCFSFFFGDSNLIDALYSLSVSRKSAFIKNGSRERRVKSASRLKKGRRYFVPKTPDEKNSLAIRAGREEERKGREETRKRGRMGPHTRAIKLPAFFNSS